MRKRTQLHLRVYVDITASSKQHCSNDCEWMSSRLSGPVRCNLFERELHWDKRRKQDGYKRLNICRKSSLLEYT